MNRINEVIKIAKFIEKYNIKNATIDKDFIVNVNGDVNLRNKKLREIPIQFGKVNGSFDCSYNILFSLSGCPKIVTGGFDCGNNHLSNLMCGPEIVGGDYCCEEAGLYTLEGISKFIGGNIECRYNYAMRNAPEQMIIHILKKITIKGKIYSDFYCGKIERL